METFQISFRSPRHSGEEVFDAIESYLAALYKNGQVNGGAKVARVRGGYRAFVNAPRTDACEPRYGSPWVRNTLRRLKQLGVETPEWKWLGPEPDNPARCACRRRSFFILFTDLLSDASPLRCGRCFGTVPLYTIPPTGCAGDYADIVGWQSTYQKMDELFIDSGAGERFGYRQMTDHRSALSIEGREVAASIEAKSGKPVFYFLARYYGSTLATEEKRRCPSCNGNWILPEPMHRRIAFRCEKCRLVSEIASDVREL